MFVTPMLSIILPVYNGAVFLKRAIQSVLKQEFEDWELIVVNDGSTDESEEIILSYVSRDSRIKNISQPNRGLSAARNAGYSKAIGKYVVFLDADDFLEPNYYKELITKTEKYDADFVVSSYVRDFVQPNGKIFSKKVRFEERLLTIENIVAKYCNQKFFYNVYIHVWNKIYKREFLDKHGIMFDETIRYAEDVPFNISILRHAADIMFLDIPGYHYVCHHEERLTGKWKDSLLDDNCSVCRQITQFEHQCWGKTESELASGMYLRSCFLAIEKAIEANMPYRRVKLKIREIFKKRETNNSIRTIQKRCHSKEFFIYRMLMQFRQEELFFIAVVLRKKLKRMLKQ